MRELSEMILTALMWYAIAWAVFHIVVRPWLIRRLETRIAEMETALGRLAEHTVEAKVEEYHGQFYLFNKTTDEFLAQGYTAAEIADKMKKPLQVSVTEGDPDVIQRFRNTAASA